LWYVRITIKFNKLFVVRFAVVNDSTPLWSLKMPDEFDILDGAPIEYVTESESYYDHEDDDDCEDGWDEDSDEDED
jgi:hypothetical protein